ncbi:hypothetical protein C8T65DRAFT_712687 [Cerioporus squamosus]|nr:hypothetical protein C8T65DRAFT_712687 [Cerioporus squamosus]
MSVFEPDLEHEAHLCEYVNFLSKHTRATAKGAPPSTLNPRIPLLGPRFEPPSFSHIQRRSAAPEVVPTTAYLKPVTIVHPLYFPELGECPNCGSTDVTWFGWSPTGHREVHGVAHEETGIGFQLRCNPCKKIYGKGGTKADDEEQEQYSFLTTNPVFWEKHEHWELPSE